MLSCLLSPHALASLFTQLKFHDTSLESILLYSYTLSIYLSGKILTPNLCQLYHICTWAAECGQRKHIIRWIASLRFFWPQTSNQPSELNCLEIHDISRNDVENTGGRDKTTCKKLGRIWMRDSEEMMGCGLRRWSQAWRSEHTLQKYLGGRTGMIWWVKLNLGS